MKTILLKRKIIFLFILTALIQILSFGQKPGRDARTQVTNTLILCKGKLAVLTATTSCIGPFTYSWNPGGQTSASISVSPTINTSYIVSITGTNNCTSIDTFFVNVIPAPVFDLGPDTTSCACVNVSAATSGATYYSWNTGSEYSSINVCVSGQFWVTVSNGMCTVSDTINVTINPSPAVNLGPDITLTNTNSVVLNAGNPLATYSWNTGATSQMITVSTAGNYSVTVTDANGCSAGDDVNVKLKGFLTAIPEGFSPNGDGVNETFNITGIEEYPKNVFEIFNRWGDKVYDAQPYQNTWDGRSTVGLRIGGNELPVGTYFYILDLGDGTPPIKGTVYLNR